ASSLTQSLLSPRRSPRLRPNGLADLALLHERERVVHILREHDGLLRDRLYASVHHLVAAPDDVRPVVRGLQQRKEVALARLEHALERHFIDQQPGQSGGSCAGAARQVSAASEQAHEWITATLRVVRVARL